MKNHSFFLTHSICSGMWKTDFIKNVKQFFLSNKVLVQNNVCCSLLHYSVLSTIQGCQIFLSTTYQNRKKYIKWPQNILNGQNIQLPYISPKSNKICTYTNIFHSKALQKYSQSGMFGIKICIPSGNPATTRKWRDYMSRLIDPKDQAAKATRVIFSTKLLVLCKT
jgi:hypothetical protein